MPEPDQLSPAELKEVFVRAVNSFSGAVDRWQARAQSGLTDDELSEALSYELGIFGGSTSRSGIDVTYQRAGLKIWAARSFVDRSKTGPVLQGKTTIEMAREVYGISDPNETQLALF